MKITPKFQRGGGFDQFFTTYTPVEIQSQQGRSSQQSSRQTDRLEESTKGRLTEKDFFEMIKDIDGLPNEMNALVTNLMNTFQLDRMSGQSTGDLATKYLSNLYQIKTLAQNKKKYDEAVATAQKNGAMAEPAISMDGKLIVQNKENGSLNAISIDKYYKNRDDYAIITVSNLANMRAYSPSLARSQEAIDIINNSMGYEAFQELLSKSTQSLGSSENSRNGFFSVEGQASKGLELLQQLSNDDRVQDLGSITAQGLYEYKIIDKSQLNQINALTSYITTLLPDRAKTWAAIKTGQSDKNQATKDLVFTYLLGRSNNTHTVNIQYKESKQSKESNSSNNSNEDTKMTYLTAIQNGYGGRKETKSINFGNNTSFNVTGTSYGAFLDQDGKTLINTNLLDLISKTGISNLTNPQSITFGDNLINSNSLQKVAVENNGGFWAVLPCIKQGNKVIPNFPLISKFNDVVQEVLNESNDSTSPEDKQQLLEKKLQEYPELQELLNMSGNLDPSKVQAFFIVDGLASDNNFTFKNNDGSEISGQSNPLIQPTDNQNDLDYFKSVTNDKDFDENSLWMSDWFGMYDTLYKSKVFIPIQTNNRLAAIIFSGQKIKDSNARLIEQEYQKFQMSNKMNTPSSKYLYE